jgi:hypothetical protein
VQYRCVSCGGVSVSHNAGTAIPFNGDKRIFRLLIHLFEFTGPESKEQLLYSTASLRPQSCKLFL